jgi:hypothetical protein
LKLCLLLVTSIALSVPTWAQNLHVLDNSATNGISHSVYCYVKDDHRTVICSVTVSALGFGEQITMRDAYRIRNRQSISLPLKALWITHSAETDVEYGDWMVIRWVGGEFSYQIGRGWSADQWNEYLRKLDALSEWERSPEGGAAIRQQVARDMGIPSAGGGSAPNGSSRPCYIVQDQIRMVQNDIASNERGIQATQGSVWGGGVQGVLNQNRQKLAQLQSELANCTR